MWWITLIKLIVTERGKEGNRALCTIRAWGNVKGEL